MTLENYLATVIGVTAVACGPFIIRHRVRIFHVIVDANRAMYGSSGRLLARRSSPWWVGFCGVWLMIIGVGAILVGIFGRE
ncbi:hypothetical protein [Microbacterium azadirachtae]|uniref:hypothetical protein n=1 Tax=Microbacterium azadirachtae TaxID=582680 RepID=UPI000AF510D6|nr:hypothetical protein [Microbacterium azadirachtae]